MVKRRRSDTFGNLPSALDYHPRVQGTNVARRRLLAAAALCLLLVPSTLVVLREDRLLPWDEAFYARGAVTLYDTLAHTPRAWPSAMKAALASRPPAIAWLGQLFVPVGIRLGNVTAGLQLLNVA